MDGPLWLHMKGRIWRGARTEVGMERNRMGCVWTGIRLEVVVNGQVM